MKQQMISLKTKVFPVVTPKGKHVSPNQTKTTSTSFPKYHLKLESPWIVLKKLEEKEKRLQQRVERNMRNRPILNVQNTNSLEDMKKVQTNSAIRAKNRLSKQVVSKPGPLGYRDVHMHPDETFFSGAWLFNMSSAPLWFQIEAQKKNQMAAPFSKIEQGMLRSLKPTKAFQKLQAPIYNPVIAHEEMNSVLDKENVFAVVSWLKCLNQVEDVGVHYKKMGIFKKNIISEHSTHPNSRENYEENNSIVTNPPSTNTQNPQRMGEKHTTIQSVRPQKHHLDDDFYSGAWLIQRRLQLSCIFAW